MDKHRIDVKNVFEDTTTIEYSQKTATNLEYGDIESLVKGIIEDATTTFDNYFVLKLPLIDQNKEMSLGSTEDFVEAASHWPHLVAKLSHKLNHEEID